MQQEYRVVWDIEVTADSFEEAARKALEIQRDPESMATMFDVWSLGARMEGPRRIDTSAMP